MNQVTEFLEFAGSILSLATALLKLADRPELPSADCILPASPRGAQAPRGPFAGRQ
jgi:hypothetical protein